MFLLRTFAFALLGCALLLASDELTVYELLAPGTHSFAITYDFYTAQPGAPYLFNPIRRGSVATDERVIDAATGKNLAFQVVTAEDARRHGLQGKASADSYIQVTLARPVPRGGEARVRIFKTYQDPASYSAEGGEIVFERSLGIKRNVIVLPSGYELIGCAAPGIVSTGADGRVRVSFVNDRDDQLMVKLRGRLLR